MEIKCICGKLFKCEPHGKCWCKQLNKKIKKSYINDQNKKCLCYDCLKEKINNIGHS